MNPFLVKELRQFTRSRLVTGGLCLLLFLQLLVAALVPMAIYREEGKFSAEIGAFTLGALSFVTGFGVCFAVPFIVFSRLVDETPKGNLSLELATALRPAAVIDGKIRAGLVFAAALVAGSLPFQLLCVALRGVDWRHVLLGSSAMLLSCSVVLHLAAFVGANRDYSGVMRWLAFLAIAVFGGPMFTSLVGGVAAVTVFHTSGTSAPTAGDIAWGAVAAVAGAVSINLFLRAQAARNLAAPTTDRDRLPRLTFLALWAAWGIVAIVAAAVLDTGNVFLAWFVAVSMGLFGLLVEAASSPPGIPRRVLAERAGKARSGVYPLAPGFEGCVQFALPLFMVSAVVAVVGYAFAEAGSGYSGGDDGFGTLLSVMTYLVSSPIFIRGVWMRFVAPGSRRIAPRAAPLVFAHVVLSGILLGLMDADIAGWGVFGFIGIVVGIILNSPEFAAASDQWNSTVPAADSK